MPNSKLKRRIWLKKSNIKFIKNSGHQKVFEVSTVNSMTKETRTIKVTTVQNLMEHAESDIPKELGFDILEIEKDNDKWEVSDENNGVTIWKRSLKDRTKPVFKEKFVAKDADRNSETSISRKTHTDETLASAKKHSKKESTEAFEQHTLSEIGKLHEQQKRLEEKIQNLYQQTFTSEKISINDTLCKILEKLSENVGESKNLKNHKNSYKRGWKEKGFVSVRTYSNPQKIQLISDAATTGNNTNIYLLKTTFHKKIKEITIETKQNIDSNFQINFYIPKESLSSNAWNINDEDNQIIFYPVDKDYVYSKKIN